MDNVLIVGAGPVGLSLALGLAKEGIPVTVMEKESNLTTVPKASTIHPPTLEVFEKWGIVQEVIDAGIIADRFQYWDRESNEMIAELNLDLLKEYTKYPYRLQCEQHHLTEILYKHVSNHELVDIRFNHAIKQIEHTGDKVIATVETPQGLIQYTSSFIVGADGASSTVRKQLDIEFKGITFPEKHLLICVKDYDFTKCYPGLSKISYFFDPNEWIALIKNESYWKFLIPYDEKMSDVENIHPDVLQKKLRAFSHTDEQFNISHRVVYNVHQRVAVQFSKERGLIIGDAAHVNNPLGGMGMNSGIHDAYFLSKVFKRIQNGEDYKVVFREFEEERQDAIGAVQERTINNEKVARKSGQSNRQANLVQVASDDEKARNYLLQTSMISDFRKMEENQLFV